MSTKSRDRDPRSFLPLTPRVFQVLLALADGPLHGYALIRTIQDQTEGLIVLRTGSLYMLIQRLLDQHLIDESEHRPPPDDDDERRRYYTLTPMGRAVLQAESRRLLAVLGTVRKKRIVLGMVRKTRILGTEKS